MKTGTGFTHDFVQLRLFRLIVDPRREFSDDYASLVIHYTVQVRKGSQLNVSVNTSFNLNCN